MTTCREVGHAHPTFVQSRLTVPTHIRRVQKQLQASSPPRTDIVRNEEDGTKVSTDQSHSHYVIGA